MAEDKEVLREVWDGKIPIRFELASNEVASVEPPDPFFVSNPCFCGFYLFIQEENRSAIAISTM